MHTAATRAAWRTAVDGLAGERWGRGGARWTVGVALDDDRLRYEDRKPCKPGLDCRWASNRRASPDCDDRGSKERCPDAVAFHLTGLRSPPAGYAQSRIITVGASMESNTNYRHQMYGKWYYDLTMTYSMGSDVPIHYLPPGDQLVEKGVDISVEGALGRGSLEEGRGAVQCLAGGPHQRSKTCASPEVPIRACGGSCGGGGPWERAQPLQCGRLPVRVAAGQTCTNQTHGCWRDWGGWGLLSKCAGWDFRVCAVVWLSSDTLFVLLVPSRGEKYCYSVRGAPQFLCSQVPPPIGS